MSVSLSCYRRGRWRWWRWRRSRRWWRRWRGIRFKNLTVTLKQQRHWYHDHLIMDWFTCHPSPALRGTEWPPRVIYVYNCNNCTPYNLLQSTTTAVLRLIICLSSRVAELFLLNQSPSVKCVNCAYDCMTMQASSYSAPSTASSSLIPGLEGQSESGRTRFTFQPASQTNRPTSTRLTRFGPSSTQIQKQPVRTVVTFLCPLFTPKYLVCKKQILRYLYGEMKSFFRHNHPSYLQANDFVSPCVCTLVNFEIAFLVSYFPLLFGIHNIHTSLCHFFHVFIFCKRLGSWKWTERECLE